MGPPGLGALQAWPCAIQKASAGSKKIRSKPAVKGSAASHLGDLPKNQSAHGRASADPAFNSGSISGMRVDIDGAIGRAARLVADDRYEEALREYQAISKTSPNNERALCGMALVHLAEGRFDDAAECLKEIREARPEAAYPYGIIGALAAEINNHDDAMALYDLAISADPSEAATYVRKAQILFDEGLEKECADVIRGCAKVANLYADTPMAADRLNAMFESVNAGQRPAMRISDSAVFIPGLSALLDRAVGYLMRGPDRADFDAVRLGGMDEKAEALETLGEGITARHDPGAFCMMGEFFHDMGRTSDSLSCYQRAIEQSPGDMLYYGYKLVVLQDSGDRAGIAECLDEALKATPKDEQNAEAQQRMRRWRDMRDGGQKGNFIVDGIESSIKRHVARRKRAPPPARVAASRTAKPGRGSIRSPTKIIDMLDGGTAGGRADSRPRGRAGAPSAGRSRSKRRESAVSGIENVEVLLARAAKMIADGKPRKAMDEYRKAEKQSPRDERVLCGMTLVYVWRGQYGRMFECAEKLLAVRPGAAYAHGIFGMYYDEWGAPDGALKRYDEMLEADPGEASAYARKALDLHYMGREKESSQTIRECLGVAWSGRESPREKRRLREMGRSLEKNGRVAFKAHDSVTFFPGLWEMLDIAFGPDPASSGEREPDFEGVRLVGKGDLRECMEWVERTIEARPRSAMPWCIKGLLLVEDGRAAEAITCYERAAEIDPGEMAAYSGKAILLADEGDLKGALECIEAATSREPPNDRCADMQEDLKYVYGRLLEEGEWPQTKSSQAIGDIVQWAAGRRAKALGERASRGGRAGEPLFPPGLVDGA